MISPYLDRALEMADDDERRAWIESLRAQDPTVAADVQSLLAERSALSQEGFLEGSAPPLPDASSLAGQAIGGYTLVSRIGHGGMGSVWLARRSDGRFEGQAAVKLLNAERIGQAGAQRFTREGSILARLTHPHIAHLVDAGVSAAGQPYLVLEHVEGHHIDRYCEDKGLGLEARLRLFLDVLAAVAHAHANLIVHRDIKPSNVLVSTDGQVKLLDFGIAKLLDGEALSGQATALTREAGVALTPAYAAPEQVTGGDVSTVTDVYSLGVLLYLLLVGQHPAGPALRSPAELLRSILDTEPPRPSDTAAPRLRRALQGDLDTIVAKALKKDPPHRYASVPALADDIRRYLDHQPIRARPDTLAYRAAKFVRRNRAAVALAALTLVALAGGLLGTLSQARRATRQAAIAGDQAARAAAVSDFLFEVFNEAQPGSPGRQPPTVLDVVKDAVRAARANREMNALARAELLTQLGGVLSSQGDLAGARSVLEETFRDAEQRLGRGHEATIQAGRGLAEALMNGGDHAGARTLVDDLMRRTPPDRTALRGKLLALSAYMHSLRLESEPALREAGEAVALCRQACGHEDLTDALTALANAQNTFNAPERALTAWEEILALERQRYGHSHVRVASTLAGLSRALRRVGQLERSEAVAREALAIDEAVLDRNDGRRANHLNALMGVLRIRRDYPAALEASREALRVARAVHGDDHPEVAVMLNSVGALLSTVGDYRGAADALREAVRLREKTYGPENLQTALARANYGDALARAGDGVRGEALLRQALSTYEHAPTRDAEAESAAREKLARWKLDSNDGQAALNAYDGIPAVAAALGPRAAPWKVRVALGRGRSLLLLGRLAESGEALKEAARLVAEAPADPEQSVEILLAQSLLARRHERLPEARAAATEGLTSMAGLAHPPARLRAFSEQVRRDVGVASPSPRP